MILNLWLLITILKTCRVSATSDEQPVDYPTVDTFNDLKRVIIDGRRTSSEPENGPLISDFGISQEYIRRPRQADAPPGLLNENNPDIPYDSDASRRSYDYGFARNVAVEARSSSARNLAVETRSSSARDNFIGVAGSENNIPSNIVQFARNNYDHTNDRNIDQDVARKGYYKPIVSPIYRSELNNIKRENGDKTRAENSENDVRKLKYLPLYKKVSKGVKKQDNANKKPEIFSRNEFTATVTSVAENIEDTGSITARYSDAIDDEPFLTKDTTGNPILVPLNDNTTSDQQGDMSDRYFQLINVETNHNVVENGPAPMTVMGGTLVPPVHVNNRCALDGTCPFKAAFPPVCASCAARYDYDNQRSMCDSCKVRETQKREFYENMKVMQITSQCDICKVKINEMQTHCNLCIIREAEMHMSCDQCTYRGIHSPDNTCSAAGCNFGNHNNLLGGGSDAIYRDTDGEHPENQNDIASSVASAEADSNAESTVIVSPEASSNDEYAQPYNGKVIGNVVYGKRKVVAPPVPFLPLG